MNTKLYLAVTSDCYELPLAVADSIAELAETVGVTKNTIYTALYRNRIRGNRLLAKPRPGFARFYEVEICEQ